MIVFADENLNLMSFPVEDFTSLTWEQGWTAPGDWKLSLHPSEYDKLKDAAYIYYSECGWGVVESIEYTASTFSIGGRELSAILDNYVISSPYNASGRLETACRSLITTYSNIGLGTDNGFDTSVSTTIERGSLMERLYEVLTPRGMSLKVSVDIDNHGFVFDVLRGNNLTSYQQNYPWVILGESKGNITGAKFTRNSRDYKNYVVINVGDDENPTILEYDFRDVL